MACYPSLPPASDTPLMISEDLKFVIWVSSSHMPIQLFLRAIHRPKFTSGGLRLGYFHPILAYMVHPLIVSRGTMVKRPQRICQFGWMRSIVSCLTSITSLVFTFLDLMLHPLVTRYWFLIVYSSKVERPPYPTRYVPRVPGGSYSSNI